MSDLFFGKRKTIFDILEESEEVKIIKEAPDDGGDDAGAGDDAGGGETGGDDAGADDADTGGDEGDQDNDAGNNDDSGDEMGNDEDFDVDTSIDDDGGDSDSSDTDDSSMDTSSGGDLGGGDEEVNPKNTNIFSTLTKEEQAIKISELKKIFNNLYIYISDMLNKVNDINPDEDNLEAIYRVTNGLYELKQNIGDYIKNTFSLKSYIENDIAYNRYLIIVRSITNTMNLIADEMEQKLQKDNKK
jgi:hypothetical protein